MKLYTPLHTPGLWTTEVVDCSLGTVESSNGTQVAQAQQVSGEDQRAGSPQRKANAYLLAAAPELLHALRWMIRMVESDNPDEDERAEIMALARAAMVKAERRLIGVDGVENNFRAELEWLDDIRVRTGFNLK